MSIMQLAFMEAISKIDAASPEAIYLATHGAKQEAVELVSEQLETTRQIETRDLIEGGDFRTGFSKSVYAPSECKVITATEALTNSDKSVAEQLNELRSKLSCLA